MPGCSNLTNTSAYEGGIHTDGYGVYDAVASKFGLRHGGCLAHVRRKFTDLRPAQGDGFRTLTAVAMVSLLFAGDEAWLTGKNPNYLLATIGLVTLDLEAWILVEAAKA